VSTYTIGEVAERSGFRPSALRYYEEIGLVAPAARTGSGYRRYDDQDLARLTLIARAKQLGCTLDEIGDLITLSDDQRCGPVQARFHQLVTAKICDANERIDALDRFTTQLRAAAARLAGPASDGPCEAGCACLAPSAPDPVEPPIVCTLEADAVPDRIGAWRAMVSRATSRSVTAAGARRFTFGPDVDAGELARLAAAEQRCCAFFAFTITIGPEGTALEVRAPAGAAATLDVLLGDC